MLRRRRPIPRRVFVPVLVLAVLAAAVAVLEAAESPSWLAWLPAWLAGAIAAALAVAIAWWAEPWAARRRDVSAREQKAVDRLRAHLGRRETLARVRDVDPLALRIHPAIPLSRTGPDAHATRGHPPASLRRRLWWLIRRRTAADRNGDLDRQLPIWIDRDRAAEVRHWLRDADTHGGFLLVVGDSSVGKTRLLYEAVRRELPDWAVLTPDLGDGDLVNTVADATFGLPKLVVWLDELQRFLPGPYLNQTPKGTAVSAASLRRLLDAPTPVIVVGTLWPEHARELRSTEADPATPQPRPRYPAAVDILDDRRRHEITLETFSERERKEAAVRAGEDPRLAEALATRDYNLTEALAGAPQLVRRYEQASREEKAVLYAAIDARRVGIQAPLTAPMLAAAARGYLTVIHPDDRWFAPVIAELIRSPAASPPLMPVPDAEHRSTIGYTITDYLLQYGQRDRRSSHLPATAWEALIANITDHQDIVRLARSAENRLLYCYAIPLYRRAAAAGDGYAGMRVADLLAEQGNVQELRVRADTGDGPAATQLANLLAEQGNVQELRVRADTGDGPAAAQLANLLAGQGDVDQALAVLRRAADAGNELAAARLAELLAKRGNVEELRTRADTGDGPATGQLADLLAAQGDPDQALAVLRAAADTGEGASPTQLASLLAAHGDLDQALAVLRRAADADDAIAAVRLADLLVEHGNVEELRTRADTGDEFAALRLAGLLAEQGNLRELRTRADTGDEFAVTRLADLLTGQGDVDQALAVLRRAANAGNELGAVWLADLLAEQGDVEELRTRADTGDEFAALRLAGLLAEQGNVEEMRARADSGDKYAAGQLADVLEEQGNVEDASNLRRFGLEPDGTIATGPSTACPAKD